MTTVTAVKPIQGSCNDAWGAAHLRSGESVSMTLSEGSYVVRAGLRVLGVPFEWSIGHVLGPSILTVTLTTVENGTIIAVLKRFLFSGDVGR